jgi:hypothetical protein
VGVDAIICHNCSSGTIASGCRAFRLVWCASASRALCKPYWAQTTGGWSTLVRRRTCVVTKSQFTQYAACPGSVEFGDGNNSASVG